MEYVITMVAAYTLPMTLLTYGIVWWFMRPKRPPKFQFRDHVIYLCVTWAAAIIGHIGFAPNASSVMGGYSSPASALIPIVTAVALIAWTKSRLPSSSRDNEDSDSNKS
jgi:hypothetical protein